MIRVRAWQQRMGDCLLVQLLEDLLYNQSGVRTIVLNCCVCVSWLDN